MLINGEKNETKTEPLSNKCCSHCGALRCFDLAFFACRIIRSKFDSISSVEALTVLPYFTSAAIPGVSIGCLLANLLTGALPWDTVFGTLASLIGAIGTYALRKY